MDKEKAIEIITSLVKGSHKDFTKNGALIFTDQTQLALYIALDALNKINSNDLVQDNFISEISIQNESKLENNISDIIYEKNPSNYLDGNLYERLKKLRKKLAGVSPAYTVFTDSALEFIARELPRNKIEMLRIKGVGERSFENYGEYFLDEIKLYLDEKNGNENIKNVFIDDSELDKNKTYSEKPCCDCGKNNIEKERVLYLEKEKILFIRCIKCQEVFDKKNNKPPTHPVDEGIAGTREDNIATQTNQWNAMRKNYEP